MLSTPLRFLSVPVSELCLATVLKSGQSFRWQRFDALHATRPDRLHHHHLEHDEIKPELAELNKPLPSTSMNEVEWAFGWGDRTVCLRQDAQGIYYRSLFPFHHRRAYIADLESDTTLPLLRDYFNLDTPLASLYADWSLRDPHFKKKIEKESERLMGIRVLNQDPWENLISFICSANNNISRITLMVNRVCEQLGDRLPHPTLFNTSTVHTPLSVPTSNPSPAATSDEPSLYAFPSPTALAQPSTDALLRQLGFGYRAPFIAWSSDHLLSLSKSLSLTPDEYLASLKQANYKEEDGVAGAREKLLEFKGVGRKVADCVLLFSLGWKQTVPVDTHVFQIAIRDYAFPASRSTSLTPLLHDKVADKLSSLWGPYAGWAQQVLFFADLKPSAGSPTKIVPATATLIDVVEKKPRKPTWQQEVDELMRTPGVKRRRTMTTLERKPIVDSESEEDVKEKKKAKDAYPSPAASSAGGSRRKKALADTAARRAARSSPIKAVA